MKRTRNWTTIVYPESAPDNWQLILEEEMVPALISPLHDKDVEATGEVKKPHYHVVIMFSGVKTMKQAKEVFDKINGVGIQQVKDVRAIARYLTHMDSADKAQYDINDVVALSGADYHSMIEAPSDKYQSIKEMMFWIKENDIIMYADLLEYASINRPDWFRTLCNNGTVVIREYLRSVQYRRDYKKRL